MARQIFQIQITLNNTKPKIWRRTLIYSDTLLSDFHKIIQTTMGWTNAHMHCFDVGRKQYSPKYPEDDSWNEEYQVDYTKMKVNDLIQQERDKMVYEYDFGDGWRHEILIEKILPVDKKMEYPLCLAGKMHCPPEDCGGAWGYAELLKIINDPDHKEYDSIMKWLGGEFDPADFSTEDVNAMLKEEDYGCIEY